MNDLNEFINSPNFSGRQKAKLAREAERLLCKKDLFYLAKEVLGYSDLTEGFHKPITDTLTHYWDKWQFHLHPRGHFKSTVITVAETIKDILNNPNETILITNAVLSNSQAFLREIRSHFIQNEKFRNLFPEYCPQKSSEEGNSESFTTPARSQTWIREATVEISSIDKGVVSRHYSKIIFDDVVNNLNVSTPEQRIKVVNGFKEYLSLLNPGGRLRIVGTRWHYYDLYGYILDEIKKARKAGKDSPFYMFKTQALMPDSEGNLTVPAFPERFNMKVLDELRAIQGNYIFSCQYMNDPQPEEDKIFSRKDIRFINKPYFDEGTNLFFFSSTDPSVSEGERSDPSVILTIAVNSYKEIFIVNIVRQWVNPDQFIDSILEEAKEYRPLKFGFEAIAFQKTLKFFLEKEKMKRKQYINIVEVKRSSRASKAERIKRIQPYLKAGQVFLCADPDNLTEAQEELLEELDTFPYGRYDDILDALADAIEIHHAPSTRAKTKIEYEYDNSSPFSTGYRYRTRKVEVADRYHTDNANPGTERVEGITGITKPNS